jgi:hypothetical protein
MPWRRKQPAEFLPDTAGASGGLWLGTRAQLHRDHDFYAGIVVLRRYPSLSQVSGYGGYRRRNPTETNSTDLTGKFRYLQILQVKSAIRTNRFCVITISL